MNVLYLLNYAGKAGTERYVELLVKILSADGRVKPFFAYHEGNLLITRMAELGVPSRQITMGNRFDWKAAKSLAELCIEWDIDVIHCHYLRENYIAMLAKSWNRKIRVVYTNHFVMSNNLLTRITNRLLDARQDQMIAVCQVGKEQLIHNGWSAEHIQVIHNGVALEARHGKPSRSAVRAALGIPEDRFVMLCASRFASDKGHDYLLHSLKQLAEISHTPFTMLLAGDGELLEATKALSKELGLTGEQVQFLGFRKDIQALYQAADLYVNSSRHEALSFLIIEAMATGLPAVITNMAGNGDILKGPEEGGILVVYNDPASMAEALRRMMEDAAFRTACGKNAAARVEQEFEVHKMCADTFAVYQQALAR